MDLIEAWFVLVLLYIQHTVHVKKLKGFLIKENLRIISPLK